MSDQAEAVAAAQRVLDAYMSAFNAQDVEAWDDAFNFPSVRLGSGRMVIVRKGDHKAEMFERDALREWDRSGWERREVIHAGPDKVHLDVRFTRYRADGSVLAGFDSLFVVTREDGHWGVKIRSSYAP